LSLQGVKKGGISSLKSEKPRVGYVRRAGVREEKFREEALSNSAEKERKTGSGPYRPGGWKKRGGKREKEKERSELATSQETRERERLEVKSRRMGAKKKKDSSRVVIPHRGRRKQTCPDIDRQ